MRRKAYIGKFCGLKMCLDIKCFADGETGSFKNFSVEETAIRSDDISHVNLMVGWKCLRS